VSDEDHSQPKKDSFAALRYKDFRSYLGMRFFFTFAYQMQTTVLGFYIYQITHSKMAIAYIGLSEAIPAVGLALYGGYIADKYEKRKLLLFVFIGVLCSSLVMFLVTLKSLGGYIHYNWILPVLYAMIFCNGISRAFFGPAVFTIYANSVPREIYPNASTWSSTSWQLASILGPFAGGFIYALAGGITGNFIVILVFLFVTLVLVYRLREYPATFIPKEDVWISLREGIHFVFKNKMLIGALSLDLFFSFLWWCCCAVASLRAGYSACGAPGLWNYAYGIIRRRCTNDDHDGSLFSIG
jgi:MFS family permease